MKEKNPLRGSIMLLVCSMFWGFGFAAQDTISTRVPTFTCSFVRFFISSVALIAVVLFFDKKERNGRFLFSKAKNPLTKKELTGGLICGVALTAATVTQQAAIGDSGSGKAAFITTLYVVLVPVAGAILYRRRLPAVVWIAVVLALTGVGLITIQAGLTFALSDLILLCSALCWCAHIMTVDAVSGGCDGVRISLVQMFTTGCLSLLLALFTEKIVWADVWAVLPSLLYLGICSGAIAFTLQILGQKECPAATASIIMSCESLFGVLGGAVFMHEVLTPREYVGCAVVFIAVLLAQWPDVRAAKKRSSET